MSGDDCFLLTTEEHLGDLRYVEVWTDVIGFDPSWKCDAIRIYDLRKNKKFYFDVQGRFALRSGYQCYHKVYPSIQPKVKLKNPLEYFSWNFGPMHTFNLLDPSHDIQLHYICRLTVVLSHIMVAFAATLAIVGFPRMQLRDSIGTNPFVDFRIFIQHTVCVSLIASGPNFLLAALFRITSGKGLLRRKSGILPSFFNYIIWLLLIGLITISTVYLIIFSWWVSEITIHEFVVVATVAILFNALILENVFIGIFNLSALRNRLENCTAFEDFHLQNIVLEAENQRRFLYRRVTIWGMRPYIKHLYKPLSDALLKERRNKDQIRYNIRMMLKDVVFIVLLGLTFHLLFYMKFSDVSHEMQRRTEDMVVYGFCGQQKSIYSVFTIDDIYDYINSTITIIYGTNWYNGVMGDLNAKTIGAVRVRQLMVNTVRCPDRKLSYLLKVKECLPSFNKSVSFKDNQQGQSMFSYQTHQGICYFLGEMINSYYDCNGYWQKLGKTLVNARYSLTIMKESKWLTKRTRAVFLEFWIYNSNTGLFNDIRIIFERGPTQLIFPSYKIISAKLAFSHTINDIFTAFLIIAIIFLLIKLAGVITMRIIMYGISYVLSIWHILELATLGMGICFVTTYIMKEVEQEQLFENMLSTRDNDFLPQFSVMHMQENLQVFLGLIVFMLCLLLFQIVKYIEKLRPLQMALGIEFWPCVIYLAIGLLWLFVLALIGEIFYNQDHIEFNSLKNVMSVQMRVIARLYPRFSSAIREAIWGIDGHIYFAAIVLSGITLRSIVVLLCVRSFRDSKKFLSGLDLSYSLWTYIVEAKNYYTEFAKRSVFGVREHLKGGESGEECYLQPVQPKEPKHRYEGCCTVDINQMNLMRLLLIAILRNFFLEQDTKKQDPEDLTLMEDIANAIWLRRHQSPVIGNNLNDSNKMFVFPIVKRKERTRFLFDQKLIEMEVIASNLMTTTKIEQQKALQQDRLIIVSDMMSLGRMETILKTLINMDTIFANITFDIDEKYAKETSISEAVAFSVNEESLSNENSTITGDFEEDAVS